MNPLLLTAETEYINSRLSMESLSIKYALPIGTVRSCANRRKWAYKRKLANIVVDPKSNAPLSTQEIFEKEGLSQVDAIKQVILGMQESKGKDKLPFIKEYRAMIEKEKQRTEDENHAENVTRAWEAREARKMKEETLEDAIVKALIDSKIDDSIDN